MFKICRSFSAILILCSLVSSCSVYYEGQVSDHFDGDRFFDPSGDRPGDFFTFLKWQFTRKKGKWPSQVAVETYDIPPSRVLGDDLRVTYVGHVTYLIQTQGVNILTDPIWSKRASPFSFLGPKRITAPGIKFEDLPEIDVVLISHNHYDHLDLKTINKLWAQSKPRIIVPLGNDYIIRSSNKDIAVEAYDWGDEVDLSESLKISLEPMQHWSARGLFDRNKALWAAFVLQAPGGNIYFVGDAGYSHYYKEAKEKYGSFRLALLPIGSHKPRWFMEYSHMNPDDAVRAYQDLGKPDTIPGHYDVFRLADEAYGDALRELEEAQIKYDAGKNIMPLKVGQYYFSKL